MSEDLRIPVEDQERFFRVMGAYDEMFRRQQHEFSKRKATDHHTKCRHCGVFTPKERWVAKESAFAKNGYRPSCQECFSAFEED